MALKTNSARRGRRCILSPALAMTAMLLLMCLCMQQDVEQEHPNLTALTCCCLLVEP